MNLRSQFAFDDPSVFIINDEVQTNLNLSLLVGQRFTKPWQTRERDTPLYKCLLNKDFPCVNVIWDLGVCHRRAIIGVQRPSVKGICTQRHDFSRF